MKELKINKNNYLEVLQDIKEGCFESYIRYCFEDVIFTDTVDLQAHGRSWPLYLSFQNCTFLNQRNEIDGEEVQIENCCFTSCNIQNTSHTTLSIEAKTITLLHNKLKNERIFIWLDKAKELVMQNNTLQGKDVWIQTKTLSMGSLVKELATKNEMIASSFIIKEMSVKREKKFPFTESVNYHPTTKEWFISNAIFRNEFNLSLPEEKVTFQDCTFSPMATPHGPVAQIKADSIYFQGDTKIIREHGFPNTHLYFTAPKLDLTGKCLIQSYTCFDTDKMIVHQASINGRDSKIYFSGTDCQFQKCMVEAYMVELKGKSTFIDSVCKTNAEMIFHEENPILCNSNLLTKGMMTLIDQQVSATKMPVCLEEAGTLSYARRNLLQTLIQLRNVTESKKQEALKEVEIELNGTSIQKMLKK